jgi:hypothetical protein
MQMAKDKKQTKSTDNETLGLKWLDDVVAHDFEAALAYFH